MKKNSTPKVSDPVYEEVDEALLNQVKEEKQQGDELFRQKKYSEAADLYQMLMESLPKCELKANLSYNIALCIANDNDIMEIDVEVPEMQINHAFEMTKEERYLFNAIVINPRYRKARLRMIKLYDKEEQFVCSQLEWQNVSEISELTPAEKAEKEKCDKQCLELTKSTLKTWGNKFLGLFGMSTDDFQVNKNPDGTMNIQMN